MTSNSKDQWRESTLAPISERFPERKEKFISGSGLDIDTVYTSEDLVSSEGFEEYPGEFPFTRGVQPNMYRGRLWTMRQYAGLASPSESNRRFKYLLEQGQTGLSVAFDLPTQTGYDSDHPLSSGEIGRTGVPICSLADMELLFEGIPLDKVSTSMTINATASILLAMYIAVGKKQGVDQSLLTGTVQNDILKEYIARGTYIYPPESSMRLVTDLFEYCKEHLPRWNTISISGYHMSEAGATAVQELAFTVSNGIEYVRSAVASGLDVDEFAGRLSFFFVSQSNMFEEIAKFRAARRIWARTMKDKFDAKSERSCMMRFHTQTAGVSLTAQQPDNNVVRSAIQALAAVLGGTQSLHVNSRDEALALPTEESVQLSLRTQQIIAHESGVADTVDPLAGSYYVERLTDEIEDEAMKIINNIEKTGGAVEAIRSGYQAGLIHENAYKLQKDVEDNERIVVGVNQYQSSAPNIEKLQTISKDEVDSHLSRLSSVKQNRDPVRVSESLDKLSSVARLGGNTFPEIISCVESYATLGEISDVLRRYFGEQGDFGAF